MHKFSYDWMLKDAVFTKDKGKVFSCFSCGGGSTLGYKLAGFDVIGCCEIDKRMIEVYKKNHNPKYAFCESIVDFANRDEFPEELYNLDILDGSPPCSSFSMAGNREKDWGKEKIFTEGQQLQVLDTLFFDFIRLAKKLQPKIVIAENVKGMLIGAAMKYVTQIVSDLEEAGYYVQYHLLNSANMGVPQQRERVFFIAIRKDIAKPHLQLINLYDENVLLDMTFSEKHIPYKEVKELDPPKNEIKMLSENMQNWYWKTEVGKTLASVHPKEHLFGHRRLDENKVVYTMTTNITNLNSSDVPRSLSKKEILKISSFPSDYDFLKLQPIYVCGMSVPPVMMANVVSRVEFLLKNNQ